MGGHRLEAHRVTKPHQLTAAWFVTLIVLEGTCFGAAVTIDEPAWLRPMIVIAALLFVPVVFVFVFKLQTKYRPEMQSDRYYARHLEKITRESRQLRESMDASGLDLTSIADGRSLEEIPADQREKIGERLRFLQDSLGRERSVTAQVQPDPEALLEVGRALMAKQQWSDAAEYLDEYASRVSSADWKVHFSRGVAHSNSRLGPVSNLASLRAYNDAILFLPQDVDASIKGRLFVYRAAIAKRLGRLQEAEADLKIAEGLVSEPYAIRDLAYNLAAVYALMGKRDEVLELVESLQGTGHLDLVRSHLNDYFLGLRNDPDFRRLIF